MQGRKLSALNLPHEARSSGRATSRARVQGFVFSMITVVEETGEMVAIALFIVAMMHHMQDESKKAGMRDGGILEGSEYSKVAA